MERRAGRFTERLSTYMIAVAGLGALIVLVDIRATITLTDGATISIGGVGFSDQLKGVIIGMILVAGFNGVKEYWLGASDAGKTQAESMSRIAEASAPTAAAAVAAASAPANSIEAKDVTVKAEGDVSVTGKTDVR